MKEGNEKNGTDATGNSGAVCDAEITAPPENPENPANPETRSSTAFITDHHRPLWMDLLLIIGVYIVSTIVISLVLGLFMGIIGGDPLLAGLISQITVYAITIPMAIWLLRKRGMKKPILSFSFKMADPLMILWGFLLIFIMGIVIEPVLDLFPADYLDNVNKLIIEGGGMGILMTVVFAPILEEILFRGVIQGAASHEYSPAAAIVIAAAIFGIIHLIPQQVINAFFSGLILGYVFYRTGSLVPVIAIHMLNNAIVYISIRMSPETGAPTLRQLIDNDFWYWTAYVVCAAVSVFVIYKLWRQLDKIHKTRIASK